MNINLLHSSGKVSSHSNKSNNYLGIYFSEDHDTSTAYITIADRTGFCLEKCTMSDLKGINIDLSGFRYFLKRVVPTNLAKTEIAKLKEQLAEKDREIAKLQSRPIWG